MPNMDVQGDFTQIPDFQVSTQESKKKTGLLFGTNQTIRLGLDERAKTVAGQVLNNPDKLGVVDEISVTMSSVVIPLKNAKGGTSAVALDIDNSAQQLFGPDKVQKSTYKQACYAVNATKNRVKLKEKDVQLKEKEVKVLQAGLKLQKQTGEKEETIEDLTKRLAKTDYRTLIDECDAEKTPQKERTQMWKLRNAQIALDKAIAEQNQAEKDYKTACGTVYKLINQVVQPGLLSPQIPSAAGSVAGRISTGLYSPSSLTKAIDLANVNVDNLPEELFRLNEENLTEGVARQIVDMLTTEIAQEVAGEDAKERRAELLTLKKSKDEELSEAAQFVLTTYNFMKDQAKMQEKLINRQLVRWPPADKKLFIKQLRKLGKIAAKGPKDIQRAEIALQRVLMRHVPDSNTTQAGGLRTQGSGVLSIAASYFPKIGVPFAVSYGIDKMKSVVGGLFQAKQQPQGEGEEAGIDIDPEQRMREVSRKQPDATHADFKDVRAEVASGGLHSDPVLANLLDTFNQKSLEELIQNADPGSYQMSSEELVKQAQQLADNPSQVSAALKQMMPNLKGGKLRSATAQLNETIKMVASGGPKQANALLEGVQGYLNSSPKADQWSSNQGILGKVAAVIFIGSMYALREIDLQKLIKKENIRVESEMAAASKLFLSDAKDRLNRLVESIDLSRLGRAVRKLKEQKEERAMPEVSVQQAYTHNLQDQLLELQETRLAEATSLREKANSALGVLSQSGVGKREHEKASGELQEALTDLQKMADSKQKWLEKVKPLKHELQQWKKGSASVGSEGVTSPVALTTVVGLTAVVPADDGGNAAQPEVSGMVANQKIQAQLVQKRRVLADKQEELQEKKRRITSYARPPNDAKRLARYETLKSDVNKLNSEVNELERDIRALTLEDILEQIRVLKNTYGTGNAKTIGKENPQFPRLCELVSYGMQMEAQLSKFKALILP